MSLCLDCQPGTYSNIAQDLIGLSTCWDCPAGSYSNFQDASVCNFCDPGPFVRFLGH